MLVEQLLSPTPDVALAFFQQHLHHRRCLLQLAGECEVSYDGRAQSTAEAGDYLLTIKPDGCLLIHGAKGVKPRNWQPTTDRLQAILEDGVMVVTGERHHPPEVVSVRVIACFTLQAFSLRQDTSFVLSGSEADMQRALRQQPELIETGLCLIVKELPTGVGSIDLFARDPSGALVVIELKRGKAPTRACTSSPVMSRRSGPCSPQRRACAAFSWHLPQRVLPSSSSRRRGSRSSNLQPCRSSRRTIRRRR